ncbi:hypothetical protein [Streptomyces xanthophaeus]|uniref:Uncharacterized protein n=1 Tax=Streptomyces xanthophaeus TaxID=67385 RepID=A0A919L9G6_9ACTN|nr:hypothetical protein [Streptomyces xanthophaeus]GHI82923.1 hypothetical protein Sxan_02870 [Streptomyces xanthophaeus]
MTTTHDVPATTVPRPETARPLENVLFSAALVARGLPWADLPARTLGLDALTRAGLERRLMTHLQDRRDGRPVRLRTPFGTFLVPPTRADAKGLLARADRAGALGTASGLTTDGRRCGLSPHVVPSGAWDALTQEELAGLTARVDGHLQAVLDARREDGALDGHHWHAGMLRLSRHVVLGARAAADTLLSEMVRAATDAVGSRAYEERAAALRRRLALYLADPEPGSLAGRLSARSQGAPEPDLAVAHALALVSTATSVSAFQALALFAAGTATDAVTSPEAAVDLALEHYPPLPALVYPVRAPLDTDGPAIAPGDEILYDRAMLGQRTPGEPADPAWALCGSPSGCATARFAALVGREVVRGATAGTRPVLLAPKFALDRLPSRLGPGSVAVALVEADGPTVTAEAYGDRLPAYGARGRVGADRLDHHAERLSACAADTGWDGSETGERFRTALLAHADRCANAAADVRRAARWLSG